MFLCSYPPLISHFYPYLCSLSYSNPEFASGIICFCSASCFTCPAEMYLYSATCSWNFPSSITDIIFIPGGSGETT